MPDALGMSDQRERKESRRAFPFGEFPKEEALRGAGSRVLLPKSLFLDFEFPRKESPPL